MRTWFVAGSTVLFLAFLAAAGPSLQVEPTVYRFGEVTEGILVRAVFVLTNVGDAPLVFPRQPHTSCGCTSAPLPKEELLPGESMELVVLFDSTGFGGRKIARRVELFSNDPEQPKRVLLLEGYVRKPLPHEVSASTLYYGFYLLVDLRSPDAYARGHLLGAINIPLEDLELWADRLPKALPIYLYDETGEGAAEAARLLRERGVVVARAIAGGLLGWREELGDAFFTHPLGGPKAPPSGKGEGKSRAVSPRRVARNYYVIVDLRTVQEFAAGHIPGALNLSPEELPTWLAALPPIGDAGALHIWLVDADGTTACELAAALRNEGYGNIYCLVGGIEQWKARYPDLLWSGPAD